MLISVCSVLGQTTELKYLRHDHNYSTTYSYDVTEITIHSDSTYTLRTWMLNNKKEWKSYNKYKPEINSGKITKNGEFYTLFELRNGNKTDFDWTVKITDRRLNFYYPDEKGKLRISAKYKRIK